jgi:hypothetical protein
MDGLEADLARQRRAVARRSAPYARALELLPAVLAGPEGRYVAASWEHRRFPSGSDRPLLLLAALRHDALVEGPSHPLFAAFAASEPDADAVTEAGLRAALQPSRDRVFDALAERSVHASELSRAVAWLWPAALAGASGGTRAVALADVGAGAGLSLVADALPPLWTDEEGAPLEVATGVRTVSRVGLDPSPLDPLHPEGARWLRACVWPGEREREERLGGAIEAFRAARIRPDAPVLVPVAAANVPQRLDSLSAAEPGALVLAYQALLRDQLDPDEREEYEGGMRAWLGTHPPGQTLWMELERLSDGAPDAALVAHVRAPLGDLRALELGRCGVHPTRITRLRAGEAELRALLRREAQATARA